MNNAPKSMRSVSHSIRGAKPWPARRTRSKDPLALTVITFDEVPSAVGAYDQRSSACWPGATTTGLAVSSWNGDPIASIRNTSSTSPVFRSGIDRTARSPTGTTPKSSQ